MRIRFVSVLVFTLVVAVCCGRLQAERLVLVGASYGKNVLAICDSEGEVLWEQETAGPKKGHAGHHDLQLLTNGNILFHDTWTTLKEVTLAGDVVWTYDAGQSNGNRGKKVHVHSFKRLPNDNTLIVESGVGRIIEVNPDGALVHAFPLRKGGTQATRLMRMTPEGNYLVCSENPGVVLEYNREGEVVWEYPIGTRVYGAIRLNNGNTLIASGGGNSVVEVTPAGKTVWSIENNVPGTDIQLQWTTCLQELPNGNRVIGNCHAGEENPQIFEITPDKQVVWQFDEFPLVGNGLACWELLNDEQSLLVRKQLEQLQNN